MENQINTNQIKILHSILSSVQILRGEHFVMHILWSGFIASFIISSMYLIIFQKD